MTFPKQSHYFVDVYNISQVLVVCQHLFEFFFFRYHDTTDTKDFHSYRAKNGTVEPPDSQTEQPFILTEKCRNTVAWG